jgi:hypothetical protein
MKAQKLLGFSNNVIGYKYENRVKVHRKSSRSSSSLIIHHLRVTANSLPPKSSKNDKSLKKLTYINLLVQ